MKHLFFDFDGTIADSEEGILNGIRYMLKAMDLPTLDDDTYRKFIGPSLTSSLHQYYPTLSAADVKKTIAHYQEFYSAEGIYQLTLYPGVLDALAELQEAGYQLNIASAKPEVMIDKIAAHFDLGEYFAGMYGATLDESIRSTKTAVLAYALENAEATPNASLMIGDRDTDMAGGLANGTKTLGVLYGFGDADELAGAGANAIIERPDELPAGIRRTLG
ncbi:HAD hydrolase-like protein [Lacticaseibacillus daqingensis]|uniref:HAD hydrolase-like protein n=1 Tax=Lacticaseibacillus daqingensis TaxID=2486014 RepID=UPI000F7699D4|nr:HAD hydrolase-like protein [Lacticaseibacillus daqingensis]